MRMRPTCVSILNFIDWCVHKVEVDNDNGEIRSAARRKSMR